MSSAVDTVMNYFLILAFLFGIFPNFPIKVRANELSVVQNLPNPVIREIQQTQPVKLLYKFDHLELPPKPNIRKLPIIQNQTLEQKIINSCAKFGCNSVKLLKVVKCESEGRNVVGTGGHIGIFQFSNRTFYSFASKYGVKNANIWDTDDQIEVASQMFANGLGKQHWSCF